MPGYYRQQADSLMNLWRSLADWPQAWNVRGNFAPNAKTPLDHPVSAIEQAHDRLIADNVILPRSAPYGSTNALPHAQETATKA